MKYLIEQDIRALEIELSKLNKIKEKIKIDLKKYESFGKGFEGDVNFFKRELADVDKDISRYKNKVDELKREVNLNY